MTSPATTFSPTEEHRPFLCVLPSVTSMARHRFRWLSTEQREEAVAETVAAAFVLYLSLKRRGRIDQVQTFGFAHNAVRHTAKGRCTGGSQAGCDVLSTLGRRRHGHAVASLDQPLANGDECCLHEAVARRGTPVVDQVAIRIDGGRWLSSLPARDRRMIEALVAGERAKAVAERFGVSAARISQLRRDWAASWQQCVEGTASADIPAAA